MRIVKVRVMRRTVFYVDNNCCLYILLKLFFGKNAVSINAKSYAIMHSHIDLHCVRVTVIFCNGI